MSSERGAGRCVACGRSKDLRGDVLGYASVGEISDIGIDFDVMFK
jgi:hypothetical protein